LSRYCPAAGRHFVAKALAAASEAIKGLHPGFIMLEVVFLRGFPATGDILPQLAPNCNASEGVNEHAWSVTIA
jgi:hypothetical protein